VALVELSGNFVFVATDGDVALLLMTDGKGAGLVLMENGRVMRIPLDDVEDVELLIKGLEKLKEKLEEREGTKAVAENDLWNAIYLFWHGLRMHGRDKKKRGSENEGGRV